jgi:hypothetical protein
MTHTVPSTTSAEQCPPWCVKEDQHDVHWGRVARARNVSIRLVLDDTWDKPRLYIGHYRVFEDRSAILLPLREADDMANLMTHLKHADIAALIRQAEDGAR